MLFIDHDLMMHAVPALCSSKIEGQGRPARVMMMVRPIQQDDNPSTCISKELEVN